jgi:serpin B
MAVMPLFGSPTNQVQALVSGNNSFAFDLYAQFKGGNGNLFFSPYSVSTCLGMVYAGAKGNTEQQMAKVFHFGTQSDTSAGFGESQTQLNALQEKKKFELNIANGLWAQKDKEFLPAFLDIAQKQYGARLELADFKAAAEPVRKAINDWVSEKTKGKINNLLPQGSLNGLTRLVLVNAIYFKASWITSFQPAMTRDDAFHTSTDKTVTAKMMNQTANFMYGEDDGLQILEMSYTGRDISMVVLLPRNADGLAAVEKELSEERLKGWLGKMKGEEVHVSFPKFKLESQFTLNQTLAQMGMPDAFSHQSDFSGMDGTRELYISTVVHKAYVDVNEAGTEAAAATGVAMAARAVRPHPQPVFRADHPFIFLIRDTHSGSILFLGRVTDPTK